MAVDWDYNGARGILLRALRASSLVLVYVQVLSYFRIEDLKECIAPEKQEISLGIHRDTDAKRSCAYAIEKGSDSSVYNFEVYCLGEAYGEIGECIDVDCVIIDGVTGLFVIVCGILRRIGGVNT